MLIQRQNGTFLNGATLLMVPAYPCVPLAAFPMT